MGRNWKKVALNALLVSNYEKGVDCSKKKIKLEVTKVEMQIEKLFTFEVVLGYYQSYDLHVLKSFFELML